MKVFVNLITTIRLICIMFLPILKKKLSKEVFIINIIILFLTDTLDGILARKFKVQSLFGSIMDTIADKALSLMLIFIILNYMKFLIAILVFEILIAIINCLGMKRGKTTKSSYYGKIKTWFLAITIIFSFLYYFKKIGIILVLISGSLTIILELITLVNYMIILKKQKIVSKRHKIKNFQDFKYVFFNTEYYLSICKG